MGSGPNSGYTPAGKFGSTLWTDNVARVYEVVRRHPEVSVDWPRVSGRPEFKATWPVDPKDPESEIRSAQTRDLAELAAALEREFPDGSDSL